jgi:hypothetical protein
MKISTVVLILSMVLITGLVSATPPSDITIQYDRGSAVLSMDIVHPTLSTSFHYIRTVIIQVNNDAPVTIVLKNQTNKKESLVQKALVLKLGDKVTVTGICSLFGKKTKVFLIDK